MNEENKVNTVPVADKSAETPVATQQVVTQPAVTQTTITQQTAQPQTKKVIVKKVIVQAKAPEAAPATTQTVKVVQVPAQPAPSAPVESTVAQTPVAQTVVVQTPIEQNNSETKVVTQVVEAAPVAQQVVTEAPTTQVVQSEVQTSVQTAPVQTTTVAQPTEAVSQTEVAHTDIVAQEALNPLANDPAAQVSVAATPDNTPPSVTPTHPVSGAVDSNSVGFVAVSASSKKKKNKGLIAAIVIFSILALAAIGYFLVWPYIKNTYLSNPKNVYETTIRTAFKNIKDNVTEVVHDKAIYDLQFSFDSNMSDFIEYSGYTYGLNIGIDPENEAVQNGFSIRDSANIGHSFTQYLKDGKEYLRYSSYPDLIYVGDADMNKVGQLYTSFNDLLSFSKKANSEEINYLIDKLTDAIVASIDDSKLSREEASITINGKKVKVANNKYEINYDTATKMIKVIAKTLKDDEKTITILSKMFEAEETMITSLLDSLASEEINDGDDTDNNDAVITFSIYTTTGLRSDVVGFGCRTNQNDSEIHYYTSENYSEFKAYIVSKNIETNKEEKTNFDIISRTGGGKTSVSINFNETEIMTLYIKDWTETEKDLDYVIKLGESEIKGSVNFVTDKNDERNKYSLAFTMEMGLEFISFALEFTEDWDSEVSYINTGTAVTLSDDQIKDKHAEFISLISKTPIGKAFTTVSGDYNPVMNEYYNNN